MSIFQRVLLIFFLFFVYAIADVNYLMRIDQFTKEQEHTIELEYKLADLKVLHSKLYDLDAIRDSILGNDEIEFRPANEDEIHRWSP